MVLGSGIIGTRAGVMQQEEDVVFLQQGGWVKHARYYWLVLAEGHLTRRLFGAMAQRIAALPVPAG